jgi:hypothetical protein
VIPAEAVEAAVSAAAKALFAEEEYGSEDRPDIGEKWLSFLSVRDREQYRRMARAALEAAAPHMGEMEWAVFRASDGEDGTPVEGFRYPSREAAQKSINSGYTQPQFWEPRWRVVGKWTADAV